MNSKLLTVLCFIVGVFHFQEVTSQPLTNEELEKANDRGLLDDVVKLIASILNTITGLVNTSVGNLNTLLNSILTKAQNLINDATKEIDKVVNSGLNVIQSLKDQLTALGIPIPKCLIDAEAAIQALRTTTINRIVKCITDRVDNIKAILDKATKQIQALISQVTDLSAALKKCGTGLLATPCILAVQAEAVLAQSALPAKISGLLQGATSEATKLANDLAKCLLGEVAGISKAIDDILAPTKKCVEDLIASHTTTTKQTTTTEEMTTTEDPCIPMWKAMELYPELFNADGSLKDPNSVHRREL